jgi:hypothetical protein
MIFDILSAWHATAWWQRSTWKPWFDFLWDKLKLRYWAVGPGRLGGVAKATWKVRVRWAKIASTFWRPMRASSETNAGRLQRTYIVGLPVYMTVQ